MERARTALTSATDPPHWWRAPGEGRYARLERERRFLLTGLPDGLTDSRLIDDRYLDGVRMRLRRIEGDGRVVCKLTQKIRPDDADPSTVSLTNLYLTESEHARLCALPGVMLRKTRSVWQLQQQTFVVDVFHERLTGLLLAELEVDDLDAPLPPHPLIGLDVTRDDRFSGGALAAEDDDRIQELLAVPGEATTDQS